MTENQIVRKVGWGETKSLVERVSAREKEPRELMSESNTRRNEKKPELEVEVVTRGRLSCQDGGCEEKQVLGGG